MKYFRAGNLASVKSSTFAALLVLPAFLIALLVPTAAFAAGELVASPSPANFPSTPLNWRSDIPVNVTNTTGSDITISSRTATTDFQETFISSFACDTLIPAGQTCQYGMTFIPTAVTTRNGSLDLVTSVGNFSFPLVATSTAAVPFPVFSPSTFTFPNTAVGASSAAQTLTISNPVGAGAVPVSLVTGPSLAGTNVADFPVSNDTCAGTTLTPPASCTLDIKFVPTAAGGRGSNVGYSWFGPNNIYALPQFSTVTGTATATPDMTVAFSPTSVAINTAANLTITITNTDTAAAFISGGSITIPTGLVATPPGTNSCGTFGSVGSGVYSFGMGSVPASSSCTIVLSVQSATGSVYTINVAPGDLSAGAGANANSSTATLTVTSPPTGPFAYISNFGNFTGNTVSVIDTPTNTVIATVPVQTGPVATAVNPAGTRAYVSNQQSNSVSVIDTSTNTVITNVGVGSQPGELAVSPDGSRVYVPNQTSNNLSVIDTSTNTVVATVPSLSFPAGAAVNPANTKVYVTTSSGNTLTIVSTATNAVLSSIPVCTAPYQPVFNSSGTRAYVVCTSGAVSVIDTASETVIATVTVGTNPRGVAVHPSGNPAYVSNSGDNSVSVIDTTSNTVSTAVPAGNNPWGLALNPSGSRLYVASSNTNAVLVFDTTNNSLVTTVPVGTGPIGGGQFIQPAPVTPVPILSYSPPTLAFGSRTVNTTSPASIITLTNSGSVNLFFTSTTNTGDFAFTSACPSFSAPLVPAASCTLSVTFTPLTVAALTGTITITSNAANSPTTIALTGTGTAVAVPNVSLATTALNFGNQQINQPAPLQSIGLTNSGFATLTLSGITFTGSGFTRVSPTSPAPDCGTSVAPGATCYISATFMPATISAFSGQISIASNAASSPDIVTLAGNGVATAMPAISVAQSVDFGDQIIASASTRVLTIANSGTATLNIASVTLGGSNAASFAVTGSCAALQPGAGCDITVTFTPATVGSKSAQITIVSDATNQPSVAVALTGNGILAARPVAGLSASVIGYGNAIFAGATPGQAITLSNTGGAVMQIQGIYTVGDFFQSTTCTSTLGSGGTCLINVLFTPLGLGLRTGELVVATNAQGSPLRVPLSGTGCRWFSQALSRLFVTLCRN